MKNRIRDIAYYFAYLAGMLVIIIASGLIAQERISLTVPETKPNNTGYIIEKTTQQWDNPNTTIDEGLVYIQLRGDNGETVFCTYSPTTTPTGTALNNGLNKANMSTAYAGNATTGSLKQRIFHRLVIMGEAAVVCDKSLAGTITGTVP